MPNSLIKQLHFAGGKNANVLLQTNELSYVEVFYEENAHKDIFTVDLKTLAVEHIASEELSVTYVGDISTNQLYRCFISKGSFEFSSLQDKEQYRFSLLSEKETVSFVNVEENTLFLKTHNFSNNGDTIYQTYLYDIDANEFYVVEDDLLNEAVYLPCIISKNNKQYFAFESSKFSSYEIPEIRMKFNADIATNMVLYCELAAIYEEILQKRNIAWNKVDMCKSEGYIHFLGVAEENLIILNVDPTKKESKINTRSVEGNIVSSVTIPQVIRWYIKGSQYVYVSWENDVVNLFDSSGKLIGAPINTLSVHSKDGDIELNEVVGITENEVVFGATNHIDGRLTQMRVTFDIADGNSSVYNASFLYCKGLLL